MTTSSYSLSQEELLLDLLKKEFGYYLSIYDLTKEENRKLQKKQPIRELNSILKQKTLLFSFISDIENKMTPLKQLWQEIKEQNKQICIKIHEEINNLESVLKEMLKLDLINEKLMRDYMEELDKSFAEKEA